MTDRNTDRHPLVLATYFEPEDRFMYITDYPTYNCPHCDRDDEGYDEIVINGIPGFRCMRCLGTFTGPYIRGERELVDWHEFYSYQQNQDWTMAVNPAGQVVIRRLDCGEALPESPTIHGWSQYVDQIKTATAAAVPAD